ncbi:MAG: glucokinase [Alphaproteobacteria bacterium]|nr:glucokinase [Alphaproteobacteria bacterium]
MVQLGSDGRVGLVADVGGTKTRIALVRQEAGRSVLDEQSIRVSATTAFETPEAAIEDYVRSHGQPEVASAALCAAGPVEDGQVHLTNCQRVVCARATARSLGLEHVALLNDFAAVAHGIPRLMEADCAHLGGPASAVDPSRRVVIGPGTGLGMAGVLESPDGRVQVVAGEGGHGDLAAADEQEDEILRFLRGQFGHVSAERVLSGQGLQNLYRAICHLGIGGATRAKTLPAPEEIEAEAARQPDGPGATAVRQFTAWLGAVAGNAALSFGALGGVFICGGIVPAWWRQNRFDAQTFNQRFAAKGRLSDYMTQIPCKIVCRRHLELTGLSTILF